MYLYKINKYRFYLGLNYVAQFDAITELVLIARNYVSKERDRKLIETKPQVSKFTLNV